MKKVLGGLLVLLLLAGGFFAGTHWKENREKDLIDRVVSGAVTEECVFSVETVKEELKKVGELATAEYRYTNVGVMDTSKQLFQTKYSIPGTKKHIVIAMDGVIKVGIDVEKIVIASDEEAKTITVTLPQPGILSHELKEESAQVYDESSGLFTKISFEDTIDVRNQIRDKAENDLEKNGVFEQAVENAEFYIRCLLESIPGLKDTYTIVFN